MPSAFNFIILLLALASLGLALPFKRFTDYRKYLAKWKERVPLEHIHDVSHLATEDDELCYGSKCPFFYYTYEDPALSDGDEQKTVLLVSGMHGDEVIGPHTLLYAYAYLKAYRIIYFPMVNPSGFVINQRETSPGRVDPNRDYPVDGNSACYRTVAARVIDMLFRNYSIDLTVALHNGGFGTEVAFSWGTPSHIVNSHTEDYPILMDIAKMLQRQGGESKSLGLAKFKIGTMDEVVYPVSGTFDDWAYAVGKFPQIITKCNGFTYDPYPKGMANDLVFLFELGPKGTIQFGSEEGIFLPPNSTNHKNGVVVRAIRMLISLMDVVKPRLVFTHQAQKLKVVLKGCQSAQIKNFTVLKKDIHTFLKVLDLSSSTLEGDLREILPKENEFILSQTVKAGDLMKYKGVFTCDPHWQGKGTTSFAKTRTFTFDLIQEAQIYQVPQIQVQETLSEKAFANFEEVTLYFTEYQTYIMIGSLSIIILVVFYCLFRRSCRKKKLQKFQEVQFAGQSQQNTEQEDEAGGDLHTARGGIVDM